MIYGLWSVAGPNAPGLFSATGIAGELISPTAQLAGTNVISFAARSILTPRLG